MERITVKSGDDSHTIYIPALGEHYHSRKGALRESRHIFIEAGLKRVNHENISLLEIGFGTGLNAYLSLIEAAENDISIRYSTVEKYPLQKEEWQQLNYPQLMDEKYRPWFRLLHEAPWNEEVEIHKNFSLLKRKDDLKSIRYDDKYHLVFFDAFAPDVQPALWSEEIFRPVYEALRPGGILVTYSVKGSVRRSLENCGFHTERLPGPPGKRQMLRAIK